MHVSKSSLFLLAIVAVIAGGFWWIAQKEDARIARLAATESRLRVLSSELSSQKQAIAQLSRRLRDFSEVRGALRDSERELSDMKSAVKDLETAAQNDSPLKWAEPARVELFEFFVPHSEADALLAKFDDEDSDGEFYEALMARDNGLVYRRRFSAVILPEPREVPGWISGRFKNVNFEESRSYTQIEASQPGDMRGYNGRRNERAEIFASELERLVVEADLRVLRSVSSVRMALNRGGGLLLATWAIYREAPISAETEPLYQVGLETRLPVIPGQFQYLGSSDFRVLAGNATDFRNGAGTLLAFARVELPSEEAGE